MSGPAATVSWSLEATGNDVKLMVELKALGVLGIWLSKETAMVLPPKPKVSLDSRVVRQEVLLKDVETDGKVLEIDGLSMWNETQNPMQSRTVHVTVAWD